jgi:signal transduction histidine kinase
VDEDMARRVLINLMENSSKFTPTEGEIRVGAKHEGEWVQLWVSDTGPGIAPADQEHVFDKFTRLRGSNKPGLGIGLTFCRLAVVGHGGRIWIESDSGKGAVFHFTFPVATAEQTVHPAG